MYWVFIFIHFAFQPLPSIQIKFPILGFKSQICNMPLIKEWKTGSHSHMAIWEVQETESFFTEKTGLTSDKKNPTKRLEHLAGRFLLQYLYPEIDFTQLEISSLGKPFLRHHPVYFSISHSFPYIAVAIDSEKEIGVDIQTILEKIERLQFKFLSEYERSLFEDKIEKITLAWTAKEAAFKQYGLGAVDFIKHMPITRLATISENFNIQMDFSKDDQIIPIQLAGGIEQKFAWSVTI